MNYKDFFKNKKIAVIGLGPHGEMITDLKFLLRNGAIVDLYDMRSEKRLDDFLPALRELSLNKTTFGKVDQEDLLSAELIIISTEISKKSSFLKKAIEAGIQVEFPETLFFKLAPSITLVGIMGMYGKSTVTHLVLNMLKKGFIDYENQGLFLMDPDSSSGALTHLKKIKKGDVVLARIPEQLLPHYYQIHISPHVAVVTSPISFDILEFQTYNNFIVAPDEVVDAMKSQKNFSSKAKILRTRESLVPLEWGILPVPIYNRENIALALQVSELFKIPTETIKLVAQEFSGLKGRIEFVKKVDGIEFYNDSSSVTSRSTLSALRSLGLKDPDKNIILILGGAYTGHNHEELIKNLKQNVSTVILLSGSGTIGIRAEIEKLSEIRIIQTISIEDATIKAREQAKKGDYVLFSPAFEAVGVDISRKERGDKFVKAVRGL